MRRLIVLALALLCACGGGGETLARAKQHLLGWWGIAQGAQSYIAEAPAGLAVVAPFAISDLDAQMAQAAAAGQRVAVILWPLVFGPDGRLVAGWQAIVDQVAARSAWGYYLADEPGLKGIAPSDLAALAARLPRGEKLVSYSRVEIDAGIALPLGVTLVGANLYASDGLTPAQATAYLDRLASYGAPLYLTVDAFVPGTCAQATQEQQAAAITNNEAMRVWASAHAVTTYIAFKWQSEDLPWAGTTCGAADLPLLRDYVTNLMKG